MQEFCKNTNRPNVPVLATLIAAICLFGFGAKSANAQSSSSFQVVGDITPFDFSVNGKAINGATGADITQYLNTGDNSTNQVTVGWNPPIEGKYIEMQYTGTGSYSFGNATVTNGDYLHIFAIAGVNLMNDAQIGVSANNTGSTLTYWDGSTASNTWTANTDGGKGYVGYSTSWSANSPFLAYNNSSTGVDGKGFSKASADGTFDFNGLTLGKAGTYLGLDIYAQVFDSSDKTELSTASTGHISLQSFVGGGGSGGGTAGNNGLLAVTPEGSSLPLIAAGLLPLAWQGRRLIKRRAA